MATFVKPEKFGLGFNPFKLITNLARDPFFSDDETTSFGITDKDQFQMYVDVHQFSPEDITVRTIGQKLIIEAKHDDKEDEYGTISRQFVRKYNLPEVYRPKDLVSKLSSSGVLSIKGPRHKPKSQEKEIIIPITLTEEIHIEVQKDSSNEKRVEENQNEKSC